MYWTICRCKNEWPSNRFENLEIEESNTCRCRSTSMSDGHVSSLAANRCTIHDQRAAHARVLLTEGTLSVRKKEDGPDHRREGVSREGVEGREQIMGKDIRSRGGEDRRRSTIHFCRWVVRGRVHAKVLQSFPIRIRRSRYLRIPRALGQLFSRARKRQMRSRRESLSCGIRGYAIFFFSYFPFVIASPWIPRDEEHRARFAFLPKNPQPVDPCPGIMM